MPRHGSCVGGWGKFSVCQLGGRASNVLWPVKHARAAQCILSVFPCVYLVQGILR